MKCENKWYSKLPSGATLIKDCNKIAIKTLNNLQMCEGCYNKRLKKTKTINNE